MNKKLIIDVFEETCERNDNKIALRLSDQNLTYRQLADRIDVWIKYFKGIGVESGDRIMLVTDHRLDCIAIWLSLWKLDCVPVPLEPTVSPSELGRALESSKAHWILSENCKHNELLSSKVERFKLELHPEWVVARLNFGENIKSSRESSFYIYTSGTTGTPKCVMYDHKAVMATIDSLFEAYHLKSSDVVLTPLTPSLPATMFTAILPTLVKGGTLVLLDEPVPGRVLKLIASTKATILFAVPYFYNLLVDSIRIRGFTDWHSLRLCLSTSAFLTKKTFEEFYSLSGIPIRSIFCTSEAMYCTFNSSNNYETLKESVGQPQKGVKIRIIDNENNDLPIGQEGQIIVSGTHLSTGYFCRPKLEREVYRNGWVYTGDLGCFDQEGNLYIKGRLSETINVGGYLVNPQEVEEILIEYPGVLEAMITAEDDDMIGEIVVAKIVSKQGENIKANNLIEYCKERLYHYKVPNKIDIVKELPKSRYGKIRRLD